MLPKHLKAVLGLALFLLGFAAFEASAMETDLDGAWRDYANRQSHLEPAYRFPHARCFGAAALQYEIGRAHV